MADQSRYSRQVSLPEFGEQGQQRLQHARVLVVGVGGLGLPVAAYLAGAGVGHLTLVDHDRVELHNLQRQVFYREQDVGSAKVFAAGYHLQRLNSSLSLATRHERLRDANAVELVRDHDVIVDAADNFAATYLLSDTCLAAGKYLVAAAILGSRGHLGVFCRDAPSYRALFPTPPATTANCSSAGVLGTAVGALGAMQAQEVIKLLVAPQSALLGELLTTDFWGNRFSTLDFSGAAEPAMVMRVATITPAELQPDDLLVDVRSREEVKVAPVEGAMHLPQDAEGSVFPTLLATPGRVVFFCVSGHRALAVAERFTRLRRDADGVCVLQGSPEPTMLCQAH